MEEYLKAKKIVEKYEKTIKDSLVKDHICSVCNKTDIKKLGYVDPLDQENGMWGDGSVIRMDCGYGSTHDTKSYYISVCDECVYRLIRDNKIVDINELKNKLNV